MPFKSKAQQRFMFAKHPEIAQEFAQETPSIKSLPQYVTKKRPSISGTGKSWGKIKDLGK